MSAGGAAGVGVPDDEPAMLGAWPPPAAAVPDPPAPIPEAKPSRTTTKPTSVAPTASSRRSTGGRRTRPAGALLGLSDTVPPGFLGENETELTGV